MGYLLRHYGLSAASAAGSAKLPPNLLGGVLTRVQGAGISVSFAYCPTSPAVFSPYRENQNPERRRSEVTGDWQGIAMREHVNAFLNDTSGATAYCFDGCARVGWGVDQRAQAAEYRIFRNQQCLKMTVGAFGLCLPVLVYRRVLRVISF
jgi:hypothetical protein